MSDGIGPIGGSNTLYDVYGPHTAGSTGSEENVFLKLLITQMQNQDPLTPMENGEFMQQIAQLSSLEETQKLNAQFAQLIQVNELVAGQNAFSQAATLLGKNVEYETEAGDTKTGTVDAVRVTAEGVVLTIEGADVPLGLVSGLLATATAPPAGTDAKDPAGSGDPTGNTDEENGIEPPGDDEPDA